jgi:hypothetical protein
LIIGIGAETGHHEHRSSSTKLPTDASGWRSIVRISIAPLIWQPGQYTSSHGMPATIAPRIVGDDRAPRPGASARFQLSTTYTAQSRADGFHRDLARARPEAFTPYLAMSLNNLAAMASPIFFCSPRARK